MDADLRARYGAAAGIAFLRTSSADKKAVDSMLLALVQDLGVGWVVANKRHEPAMKEADARCDAALQSVNVKVRRRYRRTTKFYLQS